MAELTVGFSVHGDVAGFDRRRSFQCGEVRQGKTLVQAGRARALTVGVPASRLAVLALWADNPAFLTVVSDEGDWSFALDGAPLVLAGRSVGAAAGGEVREVELRADEGDALVSWFIGVADEGGDE